RERRPGGSRGPRRQLSRPFQLRIEKLEGPPGDREARDDAAASGDEPPLRARLVGDGPKAGDVARADVLREELPKPGIELFARQGRHRRGEYPDCKLSTVDCRRLVQESWSIRRSGFSAAARISSGRRISGRSSRRQ